MLEPNLKDMNPETIREVKDAFASSVVKKKESLDQYHLCKNCTMFDQGSGLCMDYGMPYSFVKKCRLKEKLTK